jgi:CO/xanthine dehydrogenase FAD-binding subunit
MEDGVASIERYAAPKTIAEAVRLTADGDATPLAGGTDLMLRVQSGADDLRPLLLNLRRIPQLREITRANGTIRIGALATITDILNDPILHAAAGILPATADCFASGQVRNAATVGGNICNASPAADMIIPLLLLDAELELASWSENQVVTRAVPLRDFFTGPGETRLQPAEIMSHIRFAVPPEGFVAGFRKFGVRPAMDIAVVSLGIAGRLEGERWRDARVAFGAVAPRPLRGVATEAVIEGQILDDATLRKAARQAEDEIEPISDVRASAWYRKQLIHTLTRRLLRDVS